MIPIVTYLIWAVGILICARWFSLEESPIAIVWPILPVLMLAAWWSEAP